MWSLLRRYQKWIFGVVGFFTIASMAFFGTYSAIARNGPADEEDPRAAWTVVGHRLRGTPIYEEELAAYVTMLGCGQRELATLSPNALPLLFNDGLLRSDLIETGLLLAMKEKRGSVAIEDELERSFARARSFHPFVHPRQPALSLQTVWHYLSPQLEQEVASIAGLTVKDLDRWLALYGLASDLPPYWARQLLMMQAKEGGMQLPDEYLATADLTLFRFHSLEDWLGPTLSRLAAETLMQTGDLAALRGFTIEESAVWKQMVVASKMMLESSFRESCSIQMAEQQLRSQLAGLGIPVKVAIGFWRDALALRSLLAEAEARMPALPDELLTLEELASFEQLELEIMEMPKSLLDAVSRSPAAFGGYLSLVAQPVCDESLLPTALRSAEEIALEMPSLVERSLVVEMASVTEEETMQTIPLDQLLAWQLSDAGWERLRREHPFIRGSAQLDRAARYERISACGVKERTQLDRYAAKQMLIERPELQVERLATKTLEKRTLRIRGDGSSPDLPGLSHEMGKELQELLPQPLVKLEGVLYTIQPLELVASSRILCFTELASRDLALLAERGGEAYAYDSHRLTSSILSGMGQIASDLEWAPLRRQQKLLLDEIAATPFREAATLSIGEWRINEEAKLGYRVIGRSLNEEAVSRLKERKLQKLHQQRRAEAASELMEGL